MDLVYRLLLQVVLILLNAVFAAAEMALISINETKISAMAAKGDKKARRLEKLLETPAKFLSTIQVAITLSGFLGSAFAADGFATRLSDFVIVKFELNAAAGRVIESVSLILITLILSYFTLIFGELVPKRIAMKKAEKLALGISGLLSVMGKIFAPIVWLLSVSTNGMLRLIGIDPNEDEESVSEEEIRMMVDAGSEKGTIDEDEKEMITNVFEFDDLSADDIATHRTDIDLLWMEDPPEKWEEIIHTSRHSFLPVCDESVDDVVGVLNAKEYFRLKDKSSVDAIMNTCVKSPYFVPETVKLDVLFRNMKKERNYFAVVLDEYGGMAGIVTITDILESLVGDYDEDTITQPGQEPDLVKISDNTWKISGNMPVEIVEEELQIKLDCDDCDTFGGYVFSVLGVVPEDGETLSTDTDILKIEVTEVKEHRIERTVVTKKELPPENDDEKSKDKDRDEQ